MGIEQSQVIELRSEEVMKFIQLPGEDTYRSPDPEAPKGFSKFYERPLATSRDLTYAWGRREVWSVESAEGEYVSTIEVIVPLYRKFKITTISILQIRDDVSQDVKTKIRDSLDSYDPSSGKDALEWAHDAIPPGEEGFSLFDVRQAFSITRLGGQPSTDESARDAVLDRIRTAEKYRVRLIAEELVDEIPESPGVPQEIVVEHEHDVTDPGAADNGIEKIVAEIGQGGCDYMAPWKERVADILVYPEFKVTWELRSIQIGCVRVSLHLPILYVRKATVQLWVFGLWPSDPYGALEGVVKKCGILGAGAGIVAAVVFVNFGAALKAFEAVFVTCIVDSLGATIACVTPGLMLLKHHTDWSAAW